MKCWSRSVCRLEVVHAVMLMHFQSYVNDNNIDNNHIFHDYAPRGGTLKYSERPRYTVESILCPAVNCFGVALHDITTNSNFLTQITLKTIRKQQESYDTRHNYMQRTTQ